MPQEFQILACCSCQTCQVHQVKKTAKWTCKLCGQKQSIRKVLGRGSGVDCRKHVQQLNMARGQIQQSQEQGSFHSAGCHENNKHNLISDEALQNHVKPVHATKVCDRSRWEQYLSHSGDTHEEVPDTESNEYTTDRSHFNQAIKESRKSKRERYWQGRHVGGGASPYAQTHLLEDIPSISKQNTMIGQARQQHSQSAQIAKWDTCTNQVFQQLQSTCSKSSGNIRGTCKPRVMTRKPQEKTVTNLTNITSTARSNLDLHTKAFSLNPLNTDICCKGSTFEPNVLVKQETSENVEQCNVSIEKYSPQDDSACKRDVFVREKCKPNCSSKWEKFVEEKPDEVEEVEDNPFEVQLFSDGTGKPHYHRLHSEEEDLPKNPVYHCVGDETRRPFAPCKNMLGVIPSPNTPEVPCHSTKDTSSEHCPPFDKSLAEATIFTRDEKDDLDDFLATL